MHTAGRNKRRSYSSYIISISKLIVYNKMQVVDIRDFFQRSIKQYCLTHLSYFNKRIRIYIYVFTYGLYSKKPHRC